MGQPDPMGHCHAYERGHEGFREPNGQEELMPALPSFIGPVVTSQQLVPILGTGTVSLPPQHHCSSQESGSPLCFHSFPWSSVPRPMFCQFHQQMQVSNPSLPLFCPPSLHHLSIHPSLPLSIHHPSPQPSFSLHPCVSVPMAIRVGKATPFTDKCNSLLTIRTCPQPLLHRVIHFLKP